MVPFFIARSSQPRTSSTSPVFLSVIFKNCRVQSQLRENYFLGWNLIFYSPQSELQWGFRLIPGRSVPVISQTADVNGTIFSDREMRGKKEKQMSIEFPWLPHYFPHQQRSGDVVWWDCCCVLKQSIFTEGKRGDNEWTQCVIVGLQPPDNSAWASLGNVMDILCCWEMAPLTSTVWEGGWDGNAGAQSVSVWQSFKCQWSFD